MNKIIVTGASGFIGNSICKTLSSQEYIVCGTVRKKILASNSKIKYIKVGDITLKKDWKNILRGYDCLIHCAGALPSSKLSLEKYLLINSESTKRIAEQCVIAGVKRIIFLSTIGILGSNTNNRKPFLYSDTPNPNGSYAISKYEAEKELYKISKKTGLEIVIIRLPLVYGMDTNGNIANLIKLIKCKLPLPFGLIKNKKSLIGIDNLVDFITCCIHHPNASGKTFLVSDFEDVSLKHLIYCIASNMNISVRIFPFPILLLNILGKIIGKKKEILKLIQSLQVDIDYTKKTLNWFPPFTFEESCRKIFKINDK